MTKSREANLGLLLMNGILGVALLSACRPQTSSEPISPSVEPVRTSTPTPEPTKDRRFGFHGNSISVGPSGLNLGDVVNYLANEGITSDPGRCYTEMLADPLTAYRVTPEPNPDGSTTYWTGSVVSFNLPKVCTDLVPDATNTPEITDPLEASRATATAQAIDSQADFRPSPQAIIRSVEAAESQEDTGGIITKTIDFISEYWEKPLVKLWILGGAAAGILHMNYLSLVAKAAMSVGTSSPDKAFDLLVLGISTPIHLLISAIKGPLSVWSTITAPFNVVGYYNRRLEEKLYFRKLLKEHYPEEPETQGITRYD